LQRQVLVGLLFGALTLIEAGALYLAHTGVIDIPLEQSDYFESGLSIPASLIACVGLCASKRWGWFSGIAFVGIALLNTLTSIVLDFEFAAEFLFTIGASILLCSGLLAALDSKVLRVAVSPVAPSSGLLATLPVRPLAYLGLLLTLIPLVQMIWGWIILLVWLLIIGVRRIRHNREIRANSREHAA
jgi:hypothetical protein